MEFSEDQIPSTLTVEVDGKPIPLRETQFVKEAKDISSLVKGGYDAHREVGARVRLPDPKTAKPEDMAGFRQILVEKGILPAPPSLDAYKVAKPESLPAGITWNDETAKEFTGVLHKHGIPPGAVDDLLGLHMKALMAGAKVFNGSAEDALAKLKTEYGADFDSRMESAKRASKEIFADPADLALFEASGMGNHPGFLKVLMKIAPLMASDSSHMPEANRGQANTGATADNIRSKVADVMNNPQNPLHAGWMRNDPTVSATIESWYKEAYGDGKVDL